MVPCIYADDGRRHFGNHICRAGGVDERRLCKTRRHHPRSLRLHKLDGGVCVHPRIADQAGCESQQELPLRFSPGTKVEIVETEDNNYVVVIVNGRKWWIDGERVK